MRTKEHVSTSTQPDGLTNELIRFALDTPSDALSTDVICATKRILLDTVGCTVAGLDTNIGQLLVKLKVEQAGKPEATLFTFGARLPCASVAYVHSQAANAQDADETLLYRTHFACCIAMPVLAVAERLATSGQDCLAAIAIGFDVAARLCLNLPFYDVSDPAEISVYPVQGYSAAIFGTVAAIGRMMKLEHEQLDHAFGIAYATAPAQRTQWNARGSMTKYAMYAAIAEAGVSAALLAASGYSAERQVLEPKRQFWRGLGAETFDASHVLADLGDRWFITETSIKIFPVARPVNIFIDLFAKIVREHALSFPEVEQVLIRIPPVRLIRDRLNTAPPQAPLDAPFSLAHSLAMVARGIAPGPEWHALENLSDPANRQFGEKIRYEEKAEWGDTVAAQIRIDGTYRRIPAELEIRAKGCWFKAHAEFAKGDPWGDESYLSDAELTAKFREFTRGRMEQSHVERAIETLLQIEKAPDVQSLMKWMA